MKLFRLSTLTARLGMLFALAAMITFAGVGGYLYRSLASQLEARDDHELIGKVDQIRHLLSETSSIQSIRKDPHRFIDATGQHEGLIMILQAPNGEEIMRNGNAPAELRRLPLPTMPSVASDKVPDNASLRSWELPSDSSARVVAAWGKLNHPTEGERIDGQTEGRIEVLGSRAVAAFWDAQLGIRHDFGQSPSRQWLAFGIQGIAPYWFDVEAFGYIGPSGRTAARVKADYTFRLNQVAFLTPEVETNIYGKSDRERGIGSGLSNVEFGLRLRYELRREISPYIGISWGRKFGQTADFARDAGESRSERQIVAGVRVWF